MKKVKLAIASFLTVVIGLFCLVGCTLFTAGTYKFCKMETVAGTWEVGENFLGQKLTEDFATLVLNSDNTFTFKEKEDKDDGDTGTWKEEDGEILLYLKDMDTAFMTLKKDGNKLTYEILGQKITLKK